MAKQLIQVIQESVALRDWQRCGVSFGPVGGKWGDRMTEAIKYTFRQKLARGLALFLPGIFLLGFNIGTGSIMAMSKAGAEYGMSLLWTIVASCLCTYFMINLYGRYTLVMGETALQAFRKHIQGMRPV